MTKRALFIAIIVGITGCQGSEDGESSSSASHSVSPIGEINVQ